MISADGGTFGGYFQINTRRGQLVQRLLVRLANLRFIDASRFFVEHLQTKHAEVQQLLSERPAS